MAYGCEVWTTMKRQGGFCDRGLPAESTRISILMDNMDSKPAGKFFASSESSFVRLCRSCSLLILFVSKHNSDDRKDTVKAGNCFSLSNSTKYKF